MRIKIGAPIAVLIVVALGAAAVAVGLVVLRAPSRDWPPVQSAAATEARLRQACTEAAGNGRLLLIEFSAPWCDVCRDVKVEAGAARVEQELSRFDSVVVNVGEDRELDGLRRQLGARAIPYWTVIRTEHCAAELGAWPRIASQHPKADAEALAMWLARVH